MSGPGLAEGASSAARLNRPSAVSSQRTTESRRKSSAVDDEGEGEVEVRLVLLEPRPLLHQLDEVAAMDLDHVVTETPGTRRAISTLITSSSRGGWVMSAGVLNHVSSSFRPASVMWNTFCGPAFLPAVVGLDQLVSLEALERRVDLPDVEGPQLAGALLELLAELEAVFGPLAQECEQRVADTHCGAPKYLSRTIRSILQSPILVVNGVSVTNDRAASQATRVPPGGQTGRLSSRGPWRGGPRAEATCESFTSVVNAHHMTLQHTALAEQLRVLLSGKERADAKGPCGPTRSVQQDAVRQEVVRLAGYGAPSAEPSRLHQRDQGFDASAG